MVRGDNVTPEHSINSVHNTVVQVLPFNVNMRGVNVMSSLPCQGRGRGARLYVRVMRGGIAGAMWVVVVERDSLAYDDLLVA